MTDLAQVTFFFPTGWRQEKLVFWGLEYSALTGLTGQLGKVRLAS